MYQLYRPYIKAIRDQTMSNEYGLHNVKAMRSQNNVSTI